MGGSTGMAGSELLGNMLETYPDNLQSAMDTWKVRKQPFVDELQREALNMRVVFTPENDVQRCGVPPSCTS